MISLVQHLLIRFLLLELRLLCFMGFDLVSGLCFLQGFAKLDCRVILLLWWMV